MNDSSHPPQSPLNPNQLTWSLMLGRWVEFARSALALPQNDEGGRLRESVADIIMLQAVWFALGHCEDLSESERALGLDRAEVLIDKHAGALARRWSVSKPGSAGGSADAMPAELLELIADARKALEAARGLSP